MNESHEIHTSEIRSFLGCRRRWNWVYRDGFVPESSPKPLEFGIAFHIAMETFYDPEQWSETNSEGKIQNATNAFITSCETQRNNFLKVTNQERLMEGDGDDYTARIDLGIGMIEWYGRHIHPEWDQWFRPVLVEVPFRVPIRHPDGSQLRCWVSDGRCGQRHLPGAPVTYDGRFDMVIEDLYNGGFFIWDHKSAAQIRKNDQYLQIDPQVGGYTWAASVELQIDVRGFLYVEYRKAFPEPPRVLKRRRDGKLFSTDKSANTDLDHFLATVERNDPKALAAGYYDEYIAFLRSPEAMCYHKRFPIVKKQRELKNFGQVIYDIASEMVNTDIRVYPSPGQFSCSGCAYFTPCQHLFLGEDHMHSLNTSYKKVK